MRCEDYNNDLHYHHNHYSSINIHDTSTSCVHQFEIMVLNLEYQITKKTQKYK